MKALQQDPFEAAISSCQLSYSTVLELEKRTRAALYKALGLVYNLWDQIQKDDQLRARFDELLANRNKRQRENPIHFLVQYVLFPHLLEFGSGNKPDQDKASRYAKLLNRAWEKRVPSPEFVEFAPKIGIQNAARRTVPKKQMRPGKSARMKRVVRPAVRGALADSPRMPSREVFPENAKIADDLDEAITWSYFGRKTMQLTGYVDDGRLVVTEVKDNEPDQNNGTAKTGQAPSRERISPKRAPTSLTPHRIGKQQPAALAKSMPSSPMQPPASQNTQPRIVRPLPARQPLAKQQPSQPIKKMP
jgi:hypothetical protein